MRPAGLIGGPMVIHNHGVFRLVEGFLHLGGEAMTVAVHDNHEVVVRCHLCIGKYIIGTRHPAVAVHQIGGRRFGGPLPLDAGCR